MQLFEGLSCVFLQTTTCHCFMIINLFLSLSLQHIVSVLSCSSGSPLPLHLAAYVHPRAPALHVGYRLHPHPLYSRPPLQLSASAQRAAHRRGEFELTVVPSTLGLSSTETIAPGNDITLPPALLLRSWWSTSATVASYDR